MLERLHVKNALNDGHPAPGVIKADRIPDNASLLPKSKVYHLWQAWGERGLAVEAAVGDVVVGEPLGRAVFRKESTLLSIIQKIFILHSQFKQGCPGPDGNV